MKYFSFIMYLLVTIPFNQAFSQHEINYDLKGLKRAYFLIYDGFTALDMTGPQHTISAVMGLETRTVSFRKKLIKSDTALKFMPDMTLGEIDTSIPYILVIPGGSLGTFKIVEDPKLIRTISPIVDQARYVISICTGAFIVAQTGLAKNSKATTHWAVLNQLKKFNLSPVKMRFVRSGKFYFSAGVSAGIDGALRFVEDITNKEYAQTVQLSMEYSPKPHINSGTPDDSPPHILTIAEEFYSPLVNYVENIKPMTK
jgi:transcriptional regulator GlxA family with amidase domain